MPDHIFIQKCLDLLGLGKMVGRCRGVGLGAVVFQNGIAHGHAFVTDVSSGIIAG